MLTEVGLFRVHVCRYFYGFHYCRVSQVMLFSQNYLYCIHKKEMDDRRAKNMSCIGVRKIKLKKNYAYEHEGISKKVRG